MADWVGQVYAVGSFSRDLLVAVVLVVIVSILVREGAGGFIRKLLAVARELPAVNTLIQWALKREVRGFLKQVDPAAFGEKKRKVMAIPETG